MRPIHLGASPEGHAAPVTNVAFSPDGSLLGSSSYDGSAIIWRLDEGRPVPALRLAHRRLVNSITWSREHPGLVATASADKTVGLWRIEPDEGRALLLGHLARHTDDVNAVAFLPDGERVVTASEDSTALMWELSTGRFLGRVSAHSGHCMAIAVSPGGLVVTVGEDGAVIATDLSDDARSIERHFASSIEGCAFSPDASRIALACDDGVVRVLSCELDLLEELSGPTSAARAISYAKDGSGRMVLGAYDASVRLLEGDELLAIRKGGRLWPRSIDTAAGLVAVGSFGAAPALFALEGLEELWDGGPDTLGPNALATDGARVVIGLDSGEVATLPLDSLRAGSSAGAVVVRASSDPVLSVACVPGGFALGTYAGEVQLFSEATGLPERVGRVPLGVPLPSLGAAAGSGELVAGTYGGELVHLVTSPELALSRRDPLAEGSVKSLSVESTGAVAAGATDCAVRAVDAAGASSILWSHGNLVNAVATDPRGLVASASRDRTVKLGGAAWPHEMPASLLGADESMKAVALLGVGDEVVVLAGSYDFALYCWRIDLAGDAPGMRSGGVVAAFDQAVSTMLRVSDSLAVVASWDDSVAAVELVDGELRVGPAIGIEELLARGGHREEGAS
jgi:toxoflavin biosynthesis protein ToxC